MAFGVSAEIPHANWCQTVTEVLLIEILISAFCSSYQSLTVAIRLAKSVVSQAQNSLIQNVFDGGIENHKMCQLIIKIVAFFY